VFSDADAAALHDLLNPWDPARWPGDGFYDDLVMAAGSVLDVGCGTGAMLHRASEHGHAGRLAGLDPDPAMLARARCCAGIEWVESTAANARWHAEFGLRVRDTPPAGACLGELESVARLRHCRCHWPNLRIWHEVESVAGDVVTVAETTAEPRGTVLRVDRTSLRFLDVAVLDAFLAEAGFEIEARYGDWNRGPVTGTSREIITIARRNTPGSGHTGRPG
jgi:SAM-dependent methyltransferase